MILLVLFVVAMFLWFLACFPPAAPFVWTRPWIAWIAVALLGAAVFGSHALARQMRRNLEPKVAVTVRLPRPLYNELRVLLCDPRTGTPRYQTWGTAIERALREWLDRQKVAAE